MQELIEGDDYQVLDDGMGDLKSYLQQTGNNATRKAISLLDRALSGHKGKAVTMAMLMGDLVTDREAFNNTYKNHAETINQYFEFVDLSAAARLTGTDQTIANSLPRIISKNLGILAAGILLGVAGMKYYNYKQ